MIKTHNLDWINHYQSNILTKNEQIFEHSYIAQTINKDGIKTHGSESRGQEEAACMHVFWPTRPLQ